MPHFIKHRKGKYTLFTEFAELKKKLDKISSRSLSDSDEARRNGFKRMLKIVDDVLNNKKQSIYFREVCPLDSQISNQSQVRAITTNPDLLDDIKNSIIRGGSVNKSLLLAENHSNNRSYEVWNGNHRHIASEQLKTEPDSSFKEFKYPAVVVPRADSSVILPALPVIQAMLNDHEPKQSNNENDIQKTMESIVRYKSGLDLSNKEDYENVLEICKVTFSHKSELTIKRSLTRLKNKIASENSDVYCAKPEEFVEKFLSAHDGKTGSGTKKSKYNNCNFNIEDDKYKNCKVSFMSNKGSVFDQAVFRDAKFKNANLDKKLVHVFACQDNKGDSQTTLKSRKAYFESLKNAYSLFGDKGVSPDIVAIAPQNRGRFKQDEEHVYLAEKIEMPSHWIIIDRDEIVGHFKTRANHTGEGEWLPYKQDWIARLAENKE